MKVELEEMAAKRRAISEAIAEKRRFLESLPVQLKAVEKVRGPPVTTPHCTTAASTASERARHGVLLM